MYSSPSHAAPTARVLAFGATRDVRQSLDGWLVEAGHDVYAAADESELLDLLDCGGFEIALLEMPTQRDSLSESVWDAIREATELSVLVVGELSQRKQLYEALRRGAAAWLALPLVREELHWQIQELLSRQRTVNETRQLAQQLQEEATFHYAELRHREEELALRLVSAAEYRDNETGAHIRRIGQYSAILARTLGWSTTRVDDIRLAAAMHDIGKIAVPDTILLKPGRLTPEEFAIIKRHTQIGAEILAQSTIPLLQMARDIAFSHHERWDGSGYPQGLVGERIPEPARIVAIADVYDALTHRRVYKEAVPEEQTIEMMRADRGKHFDPRIFDVFLTVLTEFRRVREENPDQGLSKRHAMNRDSAEAQGISTTIQSPPLPAAAGAGMALPVSAGGVAAPAPLTTEPV